MTKMGHPQLTATALYTIVVLGLLGPLHPTKEVWGGAVSDVFNHLHVLYWQGEEAAGGRPFAIHDDLLHYPDGGTVFLADPIGTALVLPFVWLAGPVFAANALILLCLVFACWAMFWLVHRLTGDAWAAFFAGLVFGLSPITLGHVQNGVWELLQTGWIPLFVGCLLTLFRLSAGKGEADIGIRTRVAWYLATSATWCAAALASHWYYGVYAGVLFGLVILVHSRGPQRYRTWIRAVVVLATTAALVLPAAWLFVRSTRSALCLTRGLVPGSWAPFKVADPAFFFGPRSPEIETFLHLTYPCLTVLLVALASLVFTAKRKPVAAWIAAGLFFVALSMGPVLVWGDEIVPMGAVEFLLPHRWFAAFVPFFDSMEFPYRFFVMVHLCLAMAAGLGLAGTRSVRVPRRPILAGIGAVYVLELALNSGAPVLPMDRQRIEPVGPLAALEQEPEVLAVFDLPIRLDIQARHRYVVDQLFHGRPIMYSNFPTAPFPFTTTLARHSLATNLLRLADLPGEPAGSPWSETLAPFQPGHVQQQASELSSCLLGEPTCELHALDELRDDLSRMRQHGITRFAVHDDLLHPGSRLPQLCELLFGPPTTRSERVQVYALGEDDDLAELAR